MEREQARYELLSIKNRSPSSMTKEDYTRRDGLTKFLFGTTSIHDAFSNKHPEFCLSTVIWLKKYGPLSALSQEENPSSREGKIYTDDGYSGGIIKIHPQESNLARCLDDAQTEPNGLYLYFEEHSNIIWIDPIEKEIYRYDPQIPGDVKEAYYIDTALTSFFHEILPDFIYRGNTLSWFDCIQDIRRRERGSLDCFCQEYTLLYAKNRLNGLSHYEAAEDLVINRDNILDEIDNLYLYLSERERANS